MDGTLKILFVEDVIREAELNWREIEKNGIAFKKLLVDNRKDFLEGLKSFKPDIIISDYSLPQFDGMQALLLRNELAPQTPFIVVTGSVNEEVAVECMKAGADDYVIKEHLTRLPFAIKEALEQNTILLEKRAAELLLKENEEKLQSIFSAAPVGIGLVVGGVFIEVNDTFCKMTGYSRKELLGKNAEAIYAKDEQNESAGIVIYRHIAEKGTGSVETRFKCKDGRILNIFLSSTPLDKDDLSKGITFIAMDITERKRAEEAILERDRQLSSIYNTIGDVLYYIAVEANGKYRFISVNHAFYDVTGLSEKMIIGKFVNEVIPEPSLSLAREKYRQAIKEKSIIRWEETSDYPTGKLTGDVSIAPVFNDKGNCTHLVGTVHDITKRKRAEESLKESEEKFKAIYQGSNDAIMLLNKNGFLDCNKQTLKIFKVNKKDEFVKFRPDELSPPVQPDGKNSFEASQENINIAYREGYNRFDWVHRRSDGENFHAEVLLSAFNLGEERVLQATVRDITEHKLAEERIIQERRMLRTLIDNLPVLIYVKDIDCRKIIANKADVINIGFKEEVEVLGKTDIELFQGQTGQRSYADDKKVISSGKAIVEREEDFVDSEGVRRWLRTTKIPLHDKDGKITGLVGIGHDITERKREEAELQQSYEFSESLLNTIPFGMDIVDETGTILFQGDNFKRLFGEEAIGEKCWEVYRDDKKQCSDCPLIKGITIGETEAYESYGVLDNRIFEINHTGMMYQGKKAMLEIFQDITDRKQSEVELIKAKDKAEEGDRLKTAFLHNISHEIRTPMNAIVGFSTLLGEPDVDALSRKDYIEVIMQSSNHLLAIISDIVDISNIEANLVKIIKNEINVNSTLQSLYNQFILKANEKKIKLVCETALSDSDALVLTDSTKLNQILINLISNALKFTDIGYIKIWYKLKEDFLEFCVSDTGLGIPQEYHNRIFDRFYQVQHTISRLYEGTGLGLAISKAHVELMGGKIWLTSEPGKGTSFFFTIPYERQVVETLAVNKKRGPEDFVFPEKKTILVAEDIDSNFKLVRFFLSNANAEIIRAANGKEAVEKCLSIKNIDLILMDIRMPVMDGYTAVKLIRQTNTTIPIIAQTAYIDDREQAIEFGCSGFISKPFDKKGLLQIIRQFI